MKIYVITKGDYSDYHICGVSTDKEQAEKLARFFTDKWDDAKVEEYDTDRYELLSDNKKVYRILFYENGNIHKLTHESGDYYDNETIKLDPVYWNGATLSVYVSADDEISAIKIASEKRAKFLAEEIGL